VLRRYLVRLECELAAEYDGGDHGIFLGRVVDLDPGEGASAPLTYFRGELGALAPAVARGRTFVTE
jgi:flavin reductase (DIM6/NTAB) family NADH-FMN oxidoreductase RutF